MCNENYSILDFYAPDNDLTRTDAFRSQPSYPTAIAALEYASSAFEHFIPKHILIIVLGILSLTVINDIGVTDAPSSAKPVHAMNAQTNLQRTI